MTALPTDAAVTTPDEFTDATPDALLDHVPLPVASERVRVLALQTPVLPPDIAAGAVADVTVTACVAVQPATL